MWTLQGEALRPHEDLALPEHIHCGAPGAGAVAAAPLRPKVVAAPGSAVRPPRPFCATRPAAWATESESGDPAPQRGTRQAPRLGGRRGLARPIG